MKNKASSVASISAEHHDRPKVRYFLLAALGVASVAGSVWANSLVLDQSCPPGTAHTFIGQDVDDTPGDRAQVFTVGLSGSLQRIDVYVERNTGSSPLLLEIRPTLAGAPVSDSGGILATAQVPAASIPTTADYVSFDIPPLAVAPGDVLAIVLQCDAGTQYEWYGPLGDLYPTNTLWYRVGTSTGAWSPSISTDFDGAFRTWVPEPTTLSLLALGALALFRRRR